MLSELSAGRADLRASSAERQYRESSVRGATLDET